MSLKRTLQVVLLLMAINALVVVAVSETSAQERIDQWYGKEFTQLHAELKYTYEHYGEKFKYKKYDGDKVSLTMTDYRGIKCEYVSLDGGYTVSYRVDHYSKKEYAFRKESIHRKWEKRGAYYVLRNTVIAIFDDKKNAIGFGLLADLEKNGTSPLDGELNYNPFFSK